MTDSYVTWFLEWSLKKCLSFWEIQLKVEGIYVYVYICVYVCILWVAIAIWLIPQRRLISLKMLHPWNPPAGGFRSADRNTQIPRCKFILDQNLIRICRARCWGIWLSRFGGFGGCSIFSGNCSIAKRRHLQSNPNFQMIAFAIKCKQSNDCNQIQTIECLLLQSSETIKWLLLQSNWKLLVEVWIWFIPNFQKHECRVDNVVFVP